MGVPAPSLHRESTDSLIELMQSVSKCPGNLKLNPHALINDLRLVDMLMVILCVVTHTVAIHFSHTKSEGGEG